MAINNLEQNIKGVSDPLEKLRRMVRAEFEIMSKWPDGLLLIYQESHFLNGLSRNYYKISYKNRRGQNHGSF